MGSWSQSLLFPRDVFTHVFNVRTHAILKYLELRVIPQRRTQGPYYQVITCNGIAKFSPNLLLIPLQSFNLGSHFVYFWVRVHQQEVQVLQVRRVLVFKSVKHLFVYYPELVCPVFERFLKHLQVIPAVFMFVNRQNQTFLRQSLLWSRNCVSVFFRFKSLERFLKHKTKSWSWVWLESKFVFVLFGDKDWNYFLVSELQGNLVVILGLLRRVKHVIKVRKQIQKRRRCRIKHEN